MDQGCAPDSGKLHEWLMEADLRVLLMVLVHMTGDFRWISPPFTPKRDVRLIADPDAGLAEDVRKEIRAAALQVFSTTNPKAVIANPDNSLMQRMMSVCLGEEVPPEYAALNREEMGLSPRDFRWVIRPSAEELANRHVLIVGAGVCGIALGVALKRLGIPFTIVEKADAIGGTWYVNRYPGCGVDTPNHSYSFSFGRRYQWSRYFSRRDEVEDYLRATVDDFGLRPSIRLATRLVSTTWDEARGCWESILETKTGQEQFRSAFLVSAIGQLSDPFKPRIPGADSFSGSLFHTAEWPCDVDIKNKRIAVIGTGASAMQLVPTIADDVEFLTIYQRTPQWARPIEGYADVIGEGAKWLLANMPFYAEWFRFTMFWRYGDGLLPLLRKDPNWPFPDRAVNKANDRHRRELTDFIRTELKSRSDLFEKCVPSYPPYGKRILLDNGWYRTLLKPNVELVDGAIERIEPNGIVAANGIVRPADIIVYSTGFKVTELAARLNITGRDGLTLATAWQNENPTAYLGLVVPGFPNFFCMLGPNSGPAHGGSVIFQAECQTRYITGCLVALIERRATAIEIRRDVHDDYIRKVDREHEGLIWTHPGMSTYYRNKHGRVFSVSPWRFVDYWQMTHDPDLAVFKVTGRSTDDAASERRSRCAFGSL